MPPLVRTIIAPGEKRILGLMYFSPTAAQNYSAVLTVTSDATSGIKTMNVSGAGQDFYTIEVDITSTNCTSPINDLPRNITVYIDGVSIGTTQMGGTVSGRTVNLNSHTVTARASNGWYWGPINVNKPSSGVVDYQRLRC